MSCSTTHFMTAPLSPTHVADDGDGTTLVPYTPMPYVPRRQPLPKESTYVETSKKGPTRRLVAHALAMLICLMVWCLTYVYVGKVVVSYIQTMVWPAAPHISVSSTPMMHGNQQPAWHPSRVCMGSTDFWSETSCMVSHWFYHALLSLRSHVFDKVNSMGPTGLYYGASANIGELTTFVMTSVGTWHVIGQRALVPFGRIVLLPVSTLCSYGMTQHTFWYDLLVESISEVLESVELLADFWAVRKEL